MVQFLDTDRLIARRRVIRRIAEDTGFALDFGFLQPSEAKSKILDFRAKGLIDDAECEGLIQQLKLAGA